jgi:hypothetical protein
MPRARRFDWNNLALRIVSGLVLAPAALAIVWFDPFGISFLLLIAVAGARLSYEWGKMAAPTAYARVAVAMAAAVLGVVVLTYAGHRALAIVLIGLGALAAALASRGVTERRGTPPMACCTSRRRAWPSSGCAIRHTAGLMRPGRAPAGR